ncbi:hypothetical protein BGZ94_009016 [Podila epigama]|nr:hypothetical protein BGZ94_009016 [Podila epigama]
MSSRFMLLAAAIPVCYFAGYAYREYNDPDQALTLLNSKPESISDSLLTSRLQSLKESKLKVEKQLAELDAHREKVQSPSGRNTDLPGRLW